jgi:hypothetical protein
MDPVRVIYNLKSAYFPGMGKIQDVLMMAARFVFLILAWASACRPAFAGFGINPDGHLDMPSLRNAYMEEEFKRVRASLEGFHKVHPKDVTLEEKAFTHYYLGAIFASDSNSLLMAEGHFKALLRLFPDFEAPGIPVSPAALTLMNRIKGENGGQAGYEKGFDAVETPKAKATLRLAGDAESAKGAKMAGDGKSPAVASPWRDKTWLWWTVGSTAIVAAGVGYYAVNEASGKPSPKRMEVDGTLE